MRNKSLLISVCAVSLILIMLMPVASAVQVRVNASNDGRVFQNDPNNQTWQELRNNVGDYVQNTVYLNETGYPTGLPTINIGEVRSMNTTFDTPLPPQFGLVNTYDRNYRGVITWSTAAIPDDATITSATVSVYGYRKANDLGTFNSCIIDATPANPMNFVAEDYSRTTFTRMAPDITYGNFNEALGLNTYTLNPTGINNISKTGYTTFMLTHSADVDNLTNNEMNSSWASFVSSGFEIRGMNYSAGAFTPYMTIDYTLAVTAPVASFTTNTTSGTAPLTVQFNDTSSNTPTSWNWSFGDGTYSTTKNSSKLYSTAGNYLVTLNATNTGGSNTTSPGTTITVNSPVVNGTTTVGIYRNSAFYLRNSNTAGPANLSFNYGIPGDTQLVGDWDGDSVDTVGIYRNSAFYLRNSNTAGPANLSFNYGIPGDIPLVGDWDKDGVDTVGIYRNSAFYLRNSNTAGPANLSFNYGLPGDTQLVGDWDGDGVDTVGIYRNSAFYLRNSNTAGPADLSFNYGIPGDTPLVGDWDGDGVDTVGIYRNSAYYLRNSNTAGPANMSFNYGIPGDTPLVGDWDGL
jgi:PKD repeat protein